MQLIGTPSEADLGFLNENAKRYIRQLPHYHRQSFTEKFPHVHPAAIDLVEKMLTFDPGQRITGQLLLQLFALLRSCYVCSCKWLHKLLLKERIFFFKKRRKKKEKTKRNIENLLEIKLSMTLLSL